jgi:hypothetical protein
MNPQVITLVFRVRGTFRSVAFVLPRLVAAVVATAWRGILARLEFQA